MTVCGNMNRSVELQENLSTAMESTMKEMQKDDIIWSENQILEACMERMEYNVDSEMDVALKVYQADGQKGILSLCAVGEYTHPNGMQGETKWERTVIYEPEGEQKKMEYCTVSFYMSKEDLLSEGACYKQCSVMQGERIMTPTDPKKNGMAFKGWKDSNDYMADFSQPISQNRCYYATWE